MGFSELCVEWTSAESRADKLDLARRQLELNRILDAKLFSMCTMRRMRLASLIFIQQWINKKDEKMAVSWKHYATGKCVIMHPQFVKVLGCTSLFSL